MFLRDLEQSAHCWPCLEPRVGPDYLQSPFHSVSCYEWVYKCFHEKHFLLPPATCLLLTAEVFLNYSGTSKSREYRATYTSGCRATLCESSNKTYLIMSFYICWEISLYKSFDKAFSFTSVYMYYLNQFCKIPFISILFPKMVVSEIHFKRQHSWRRLLDDATI